MHRIAPRCATRGIAFAALALICLAAGSAFAASPDDNWSNEFGVPGVTGYVKALVNYQNTLIVGGDFADADGVPMKDVVQFTGGQFVAMGAGFNHAVTSLAVANGVLYAAGDFDSSGTTPLPHVARWNGSAWVAVGAGGPDDPLRLSVVADGTNLLLLGAFTHVGAVAAKSVAVWNGTAWSALGVCPLDAAYCATRYGTDLVVGGTGLFTGSLVRWNGTAWSNVPGSQDENTGAYPDINHVAAIGTRLYVTGPFTAFSAGPAEGIAQYDGAAWSSLADVAPDDEIQNAFVDGGQLVITGAFATTPGSHAAKWDGSAWTPLGFGLALVGGDVFGAARVGTNLYFGGTFPSVFDGTAYRVSANLATWNGTSYSAITTRGAGILGPEVEALGTYGGKLIAGGTFTQTIDNNGPLNNIAAWDGSHWSALGAGLPGGFSLVTSLANWNSQLVVAGYIPTAGAVTANGIAAWDGSAWHDFAGGFSGQQVDKVAVVGTTLYAASAYSGLGNATSGGAAMGRVARWSGTQWQSIATTAGGLSTGNVALVAWNGQLVLGGSFTSVNGVPANDVAIWNGTTWSALGSGFNGWITSLAVHNNELYASGTFTSSGATPVPGHVARWTGSAWVPVGVGFDNVAFEMMSFGGKLYAAGNFVTTGGTTVNSTAVWDGTAWTGLGSGITSGYARVLGNWNGGVYAGGTLDRAGVKRSINIAHWTPPTAAAVPPGATPRTGALALSSPWPNPSQGGVRATLRLGAPAFVTASVLDAGGRIVRTLAAQRMEAGPRTLQWDGTDARGRAAAAGIYWLQVRSGGDASKVKVAIVR